MALDAQSRHVKQAESTRCSSDSKDADQLYRSSSETTPLLSHPPSPGQYGRHKSGCCKLSPRDMRALAYGILNVTTTVGIVMANKAVMQMFGFKFPVALTWCHSLFTAVGMHLMSMGGIFERKRIAWWRVLPVAAAYVAFIVFNNLSLKYNTVGFYQLTKILITPVVIVIEVLLYAKHPTPHQVAATCVLLFGVTLATVTDQQVASNPIGVVVGATATLASALYQVWAGSKQQELQMNANQLVHQAAPQAVVLLSALMPVIEPVGWGVTDPAQAAATLVGFDYTVPAVTAIAISSVLGLLVTLSAFLFIGETSPLTYNVVGHVKTVLIMAGGILIFNDELGMLKTCGLGMAMTGIVWYTTLPRDQPAKVLAISKA